MIISILGTAGRDFKTKEPVSFYYDCGVLAKESRAFCNSLDMLLHNYPKEEGYFIGTKIAIDFQKELLSFNKKRHHFIEVEDDSLDDVFEKILELLNQEPNEAILDITHGFRHQPIMAIFASTLSQFLERKDLKIIYAKEKERFKSYEYIYLNEYIEITQISLLLTGFIRTLNFIPVKNMKLLNNEIFEDFSKSLLSNDMKGVERDYFLLKEELARLEKNAELKHLNNLILKVKSELEPLEMLSFFASYQKYIVLSKMMVEKNYLVVALAYIFESLREYCSFRFESVCVEIDFKDSYERNDNVMKSIGNYRKENKILKRYPNLYKQNKETFKKVNKLYNKLRKRRNALAHINTKSNFEDIKSDLNQMIDKVEKLFNDGILNNLRINEN